MVTKILNGHTTRKFHIVKGCVSTNGRMTLELEVSVCLFIIATVFGITVFKIRLTNLIGNFLDDLPEWSTEDNKDSESVGTFDATGAFMEAKVCSLRMCKSSRLQCFIYSYIFYVNIMYQVDGCKPPDGEGDELPENDYQKRPSSSPVLLLITWQACLKLLLRATP